MIRACVGLVAPAFLVALMTLQGCDVSETSSCTSNGEPMPCECGEEPERGQHCAYCAACPNPEQRLPYVSGFTHNFMAECLGCEDKKAKFPELLELPLLESMVGEESIGEDCNFASAYKPQETTAACAVLGLEGL